MRRRSGLWLVIASLLATSPAASASEVSDFDRFQLWHDCLPIDLIVEELPKDAGDIGLTKEEIMVAVRSRLRAARLYNADAVFSYLYVNVHVVGLAFSIEFSFSKWVKDYVFDNEGYATTWTIGSAGMHGKNSNYILSSVSRHVDSFIDEYLRVNADACG